MFEDVLGWTDPSNNKAWYGRADLLHQQRREHPLASQSATSPRSRKVTDQALNPIGPKGRFHMMSAISHSIFNFSPQKEEAHAFLRWLMDPKQLGGWYASADSYYQPLLHGYDNAPMWHVEPRNIPYRDSLTTAHLPGWPAPPSRRSAESVAKYVVVDMFAKACTGTSTKEVIKNAEAQLEGNLPSRPDRCARLEHVDPLASLCVAIARLPAAPAFSRVVWLDRESVFSWLMMAPPLLFLAALVGYPFCLRHPAQPAGPAGRARRPSSSVSRTSSTDFHDPIFWQVAVNTFVYTVAATLLKMVGGLGLALAMNQQFPLKNLVRALLLLPFIVPTVLSTVAWMWILDPAFSVVNWLLIRLGIAQARALLARQPDPGDVFDHHDQHLARPAVLRHHPARRAADRAARALRGGDHRRRQRLAALSLCHLAAAASRSS